jgi:hypothetical protein
MFIDREYFEGWMKRILERMTERFDRMEERLTRPAGKERRTYNGEALLDNQDLCVMLNVSKRSLQRYRSLGWLPYRRIDQKTYYLPSEVEKFIRERMQKKEESKKIE